MTLGEDSELRAFLSDLCCPRNVCGLRSRVCNLDQKPRKLRRKTTNAVQHWDHVPIGISAGMLRALSHYEIDDVQRVLCRNTKVTAPSHRECCDCKFSTAPVLTWTMEHWESLSSAIVDQVRARVKRTGCAIEPEKCGWVHQVKSGDPAFSWP